MGNQSSAMQNPVAFVMKSQCAKCPNSAEWEKVNKSLDVKIAAYYKLFDKRKELQEKYKIAYETKYATEIDQITKRLMKSQKSIIILASKNPHFKDHMKEQIICLKKKCPGSYKLIKKGIEEALEIIYMAYAAAKYPDNQIQNAKMNKRLAEEKYYQKILEDVFRAMGGDIAVMKNKAIEIIKKFHGFAVKN
jgi:hypothetical protein